MALDSSMAANPKPAATLVLVRERPSGDPVFEVLLVERNHRSKFGAGAFVFPGGVLEPKDHSIAAGELSPGLNDSQATCRISGISPAENALGLYIAAIRETFEETLVLLAQPEERCASGEGVDIVKSMEKARREILQGNLDFFSWVKSRNLHLATDKLLYFAHWITPEGLPIRYSTYFFLMVVKNNPTVIPDGREIVGYKWLEPRVALEKAGQGEFHLMDPTIRNLELLARFSSVSRMIRDLTDRKVSSVLPKIRMNPNGTRDILYPWDTSYHDE